MLCGNFPYYFTYIIVYVINKYIFFIYVFAIFLKFYYQNMKDIITEICDIEIKKTIGKLTAWLDRN